MSVILTYHCNAKCSMCNVWKNPSLPDEEITLEILKKLPFGINNQNLTGGEPTLRSDLAEIVDLLYPRTAKYEISSNGLNPEKIKSALSITGDLDALSLLDYLTRIYIT
jgi:MoaA/NifB/PqqE/SkfB family radical SAM enzyme